MSGRGSTSTGRQATMKRSAVSCAGEKPSSPNLMTRKAKPQIMEVRAASAMSRGGMGYFMKRQRFFAGSIPPPHASRQRRPIEVGSRMRRLHEKTICGLTPLHRLEHMPCDGADGDILAMAAEFDQKSADDLMRRAFRA